MAENMLIKELLDNLRAVGGFTPAEGGVSVSTRQIRLLGRIPNPASAQHFATTVLRGLLQRGRDPEVAWVLDVSKSFFLRGASDELRWAWRILVQPRNPQADVMEAVPSLNEALRGFLSTATDEIVVPLVGNRNQTPAARGDSPIGYGKGVLAIRGQ